MPDEQDTSDYKLSKSGRKVRAHKIVFNKGEEEQMKNPQVNEVLSKDDPASKWIKDFVYSDNPKFEGKSKKKRINMALGAYYGAQRSGVKEDIDMEVVSIAEMIDRVRETLAEGLSKQFEIIYLDQSGERKRKIVSGTSKEAVARQFKKQYKLEIEQVKQLQQGVAEEVELDEEHLLVAKSELKKHKDWMDSEGYDTKTKPLPVNHPKHKTHVQIEPNSPIEHSYHLDGYAVNEEVEQIDELSSGTIDSYRKKLGTTLDTKPAYTNVAKTAQKEKNAPIRAKIHNALMKQHQAIRREKGMSEPAKKLPEEVEQIDELKKSTLMRYASKATKSAISMGVKAARARDEDDMATWAKNRNKAERRDRNVQKAIAKMRSEEVEDMMEGNEPKLGTVKANLMNTKTPTVQVQVFKHNTLRGDSYWVTKEARKFKTMDQAHAYINRINKQGVAEEVEQIDKLVEAVQVSHDRYMRSHQKMASGRGNWMFTHKRSGDVNYRNDSEVHQASGSFADAKKSAKMWAQKHGHSTVYVME